MTAKIYIEGGGDSKELHSRCRRGFRRLLEKCEFKDRMPRLVAGGSRNATYDMFRTAHKNADDGNYIAMLVDSEEPMHDIEQSWLHLQKRDGWKRPNGAEDAQVLLMTTCMETWLVVARNTLERYYGSCLQTKPLPGQTRIEERTREMIQSALSRATRSCKNPYSKGKQSFEIVGRIEPSELREYLPSFKRFERILSDKL